MKPTFSGAPWASAGIGNGEASPRAAVPAAPFRIVRRVGRMRRFSPLMALSSLEYGRSGAAPEASGRSRKLRPEPLWSHPASCAAPAAMRTRRSIGRGSSRARAGRKQGMFVGRHAIEVGWGDCDPARIVFFPRYFEWFEICTTALFRDAGLPLHAMFAERNMVGIPLLHFGSGYGHILEVESRVVAWKAKTFRVEHRFFRDGRLAVEGHEVRVWAVPDPTGEKPMRSAPIPPDVVARFTDQRVASA